MAPDVRKARKPSYLRLEDEARMVERVRDTRSRTGVATRAGSLDSVRPPLLTSEPLDVVSYLPVFASVEGPLAPRPVEEYILRSELHYH